MSHHPREFNGHAISAAPSSGADDRLLQDVAALVGVPWQLYGRDPADGLDCLTLCWEVYRLIGRRFPLPPRYDLEGIPGAEFLEFERHFAACPPEPWAIVDMGPDHCGVLLPQRGGYKIGGDLRVIHCRQSTGVVVQRLTILRHQVSGFFRLRSSQPSAISSRSEPARVPRSADSRQPTADSSP